MGYKIVRESHGRGAADKYMGENFGGFYGRLALASTSNYIFRSGLAMVRNEDPNGPGKGVLWAAVGRRQEGRGRGGDSHRCRVRRQRRNRL